MTAHRAELGVPPSPNCRCGMSLDDRLSRPLVEMSVAVDPDRRLVAQLFLAALYRRAPERALVEVRYRTADGMGRFFDSIERLDLIAQRIVALASETDVYVGVLPRRQHGGGREDLVDTASVVWADCDTAGAVSALRRFRPMPAMVVSSGTAQNCHAYWFLRKPVSLDAIELLNRRLALTLGADVRCSDPARILRPSGSVNMKHDPATPVRLLRCAPRQLVDIADLQRDLPPLPEPPAARPPCAILAGRSADTFDGISPRVYFERLTGLVVGRSGKVCCPFHEDRTPSLHVWEEPTRGWYCFGCGRGGSVYQLAAWLWLPAQVAAAPLRGQDFTELRARLEDLFSSDIT